MVELSSTADRPGAGGLRSRLRDFWFTVDLRSAGLFRILLGLVLVAHWIGRWRWLDVLYTAGGVLPATVQAEIRGVAVSKSGAWPALGWWTPLEWLDSITVFGHDIGPWAGRGFFLAVLVCYLMFVVGYRTRLAGMLSLLGWAAIVHRNPYTLIGADFVTGSLILWAQFLPLGVRFSVDALRQAVARGVALPKHWPEGDEPSVPAARRSGFCIGAFGVVLQIGMIYLFTGLWKTVPMLWNESSAWRDGTAIHYVLHMEQSIRTAALWTREMPLWFIRCLSYGTLVLELAALPMFMLPWPQPLLRRIAIAGLMVLHLGIAATLDAGLFSHVMVASYAVLLTAADWELLKRMLVRLSRPATVYYDDGCGICTRTCEILAACDRFGRLSFIGSSDREAYRHPIPEGLTEKTVVVFDDRSGRMYVRSRAMAATLRGLPLPYHVLAWFALPGLRWISDGAYDVFARNRHRVSAWLGLTACHVPSASERQRSGPRGTDAGESVSEARRMGAKLRHAERAYYSGYSGRPSPFWNVAAGVVLASVVAANLLENLVGLEMRWRAHTHFAQAYSDHDAAPTPERPTGALGLLEDVERFNEQGNVIINFTGAIQRWNMFAPNPPGEDHWWVADGLLKDGGRLDPMTGKETNFITQPSFQERRYERVWGTYLQYALGNLRPEPERYQAAEILRRAFCQHVVESYNRAVADDKQIARLELWLIRRPMPSPRRANAPSAALWPDDQGGSSRLERTIVPDRQWNPYRWGLLIAAYSPAETNHPYESGAIAGDSRLLSRRNWRPSGDRSGEGPYHLDWETPVGTWSERGAAGIYQQGPYVRGDQPNTSQKDGLWRVFYANGRWQSEGRYDHGRRQGLWTSYYETGEEREEVTYVNDKREETVWRWHPALLLGQKKKDRRKEHGQYKDDQPDGLWTYWDTIGFRYQEGSFERGQRHGDWTFWYRNGRLWRREHYENGARNGPFTEYFEDGRTVFQQGEMRDGTPQGAWRKFFADGQPSEEGEYAHGLRAGVWKLYYESPAGKPPQLQKEETYVRGKLEGPFVEYYEDGTKKQQGQHAANQRQGLWTAWHPNGKEERRGELKDDREQGLWVFWYENGQKQREGSFDHGRQQGEWKQYRDTGELWMVGPFVDDRMQGRWTFLHRNGRVNKRGEMSAGKPTGHWEEWNEEGTKVAEGDYADGKKVGTWKTWVKGQETQQTYKDDVLIDTPAAVQAP